MTDDEANRSAAGAARLAVAALYIWIAIEVGVIVADLDFVAGGGYDVWFATREIVAVAQLAGYVTFFVSGIFVLLWFYRAMAAAHRMAPDLTISPGGAMGWFFVPIANLWKPYEAMVQIVEGSSASPQRGRRVRDLIFWWWGAWIARTVAGLFQQFSARDQGITPNTAIAMLAFAVFGIAAAAVLQAIIRGVRRLQGSYVDASIFD